MMMTLNDSTGFSTLDRGDEFTFGEDAIMTKLELLQEQLDELTEKVNNLNLTENDGYSIES